jgi:hypothetical protein
MAQYTLVDDEPELATGVAPKYTEVTPEDEQSYLAGLTRSVLGQGTLFGFGDEIAAGLRSIGSETYDDALKDERAKVEQFRQENPKTAMVGELLGGIATPGIGLVAGAIKPAATLAGRAAQGAKLGAGFGGAYGFASGEGGDGDLIDQFVNRGDSAVKGALAGGVLGGAIPVAGAVVGGGIQRARDAISPTIARATQGIEGAADEVIANRLRRADLTADDVATDLATGQQATQFKGSQATLPEMIVDTSPAMQKLGGSVYRSGNEANRIAAESLGNRQGGDPAQGLFGKAKRGDDPTNQYERIIDTFKRAFSVKSKEFGKQKLAIENEQAVLGNSSYQKAFANHDAFEAPLADTLTAWNLKVRDEPGKAEQAALQEALNLFRRPDKSLTSQALNNSIDDMTTKLQSLVDKAREAAAKGDADAAQKLMDRATVVDRNRDLVVRRLQESYSNIGNQPYPIDTMKRFDLAKRSLDGMIGEAKNSNVKRLLVNLKNDMLDAVHGGDRNNPTMNVAYSEARSEWGSRAELLEALDMGKKYMSGGDVSAQDFAGLTNAQKTMFRLGVTKALEPMLGGKAIGPTSDFTSVLRQPKVYEKLRDITPQGKTSDNLNELISREARMSRTAGKVTGNSATAERMADDAEFAGRDLLGAAIDKYRQQPTLINMGLDMLRAGAEQAFGFRDDMAVALAKRLFEASPQEQQVILARIQQRMGQQKTAKFLDFVSRASLVGTTGLAGQVGQAIAEAQAPSE